MSVFPFFPNEMEKNQHLILKFNAPVELSLFPFYFVPYFEQLATLKLSV